MDEGRTTPSGQPMPWECSRCGMPFRRLLYAIDHLRTRHDSDTAITLARPFDRRTGTDQGSKQADDSATTVRIQASYEAGCLQALKVRP